MLEEVGVDQVAGTLVERAVDGDNVALRNHLLKVLNTASVDRLLSIWEPMMRNNEGKVDA